MAIALANRFEDPMPLNIRRIWESCATLTGTTCLLVAGCSIQVVEAQTATMSVDGGTPGVTEATGGEFTVQARATRGAALCGEPAAPPNGRVRIASAPYRSIASYACSIGFDLSGEALRR